MTIEEHPLEPFLPAQAKILFLGSFPPPQSKWSMEFFYPNWINDFWRIQGLIHFGDKTYFEERASSSGNPSQKTKSDALKRFDKERIAAFCNQKGIALFDTAKKVCRLKDNADDNFLEIVEGTDVFALLAQMPECHTLVTTGGKASEELQSYFAKHGMAVKIPKVGDSVQLLSLRWWRMPSTSRAYPMKLEQKAEYYKRLWE